MTVDGYLSGPGASTAATALALAKVRDAATVVLCEGISDQIALETAAAGRGRDLGAERIVVVPIGGAHAIGGFLPRLGSVVRLAALCDLREADLFRRALHGTGHLGLFICVEDLEDELLRAVGTAAMEALAESQGDLGALRSLRRQPAWRDRAPEAQVRRFLASGSRRKLRYARLLVEAALHENALPPPLDALLTAV
ncbi:TOPRIM nucleotidyl transferase/hydrolase domain-containing protein [Dactylosporangium sp. NPDC005572]|uniref:TOPRIM nucleotidyl transferase/hydrolase domain-containing protein n=1 Tax=Dactylosporangium sp. NPDC005572 TaxID=3156889 RepID=UPI0033B6F978